uniref:Alpha 1 protein n=1 Tax=Bovine ephemeral fever virus TaxID=11303 RepID=A0A5B9BKW8_BEFV|nr:alpha 1 protein [Bovine ephemeral fever virus]QED88219.1 alpha 1 protein [Bovine ephemeral fever virus]QED88230.1 alpha 1 protein [Bovine ephemeral fever virus]QED88241.1 alpha 1 protein [Bovine ephemeral fever virus]
MEKGLFSNFWDNFKSWSEDRKSEIISWWDNLESKVRLGFWIILIILLGIVAIRIATKVYQCIKFTNKGVKKIKRVVRKKRSIKKYRKT